MATLANPVAYNATSNDNHSLALKLFAGETLAVYARKTYMINMTRTKKPLNGGRVASFPVFAKGNAKYHTPGDNLITGSNYLNNIKVGERLVWADKILQSSLLLDNLQMKMSSWEERAPYTQRLTDAMKEVTEEALFKLVARGSKLTAGLMEGKLPTGAQTVGYTAYQASSASVAGTDLIDYLFDCQASWNGNDVPFENRFAFVRPADFIKIQRTLNSSTKAYQTHGYTNGATIANLPETGVWVGDIYVMPSSLMAALWTAGALDPGGTAVLDTTTNPNRYGGSAQYIHNELTADPATAASVDAQTPIGNRYNFDFSTFATADATTAAGKPLVLAWQQEALATVTCLAPTVEATWMPEYLAWLITVHEAQGHGVLRQECTGALLATS